MVLLAGIRTSPPSSKLPTKRKRSSITEHSFHGISTPRKKPGSVTHVFGGTIRYLCLGSFRLFQRLAQ